MFSSPCFKGRKEPNVKGVCSFGKEKGSKQIEEGVKKRRKEEEMGGRKKTWKKDKKRKERERETERERGGGE